MPFLIDLIYFLLTFFGLLILFLHIATVARGAPYVPSSDASVKAMLALAKIKPSDKAVDLGSGDGKLVILLAQHGAEAHGYEINPWLVWRARRKIAKLGLEKKAFIHWQSLWAADISSYTLVVLYGVPYIMTRLEKKLQAELPVNARIVSNAFSFPNWQSTDHDGHIYLYSKDQALDETSKT